MTEVTIPFAFPGEGMVINGAVVTPDTEMLGDEALDELPAYRRVRDTHK